MTIQNLIRKCFISVRLNIYYDFCAFLMKHPLFVDANNLYGQALSMPLPQRDFQWVEEETERERILRDLPSMDINGSTGFVVEVDLKIPSHLHDLCDDLPLAPEKAKVPKEWLTPYMVDLLGEKRFYSSEKLLLTHLPKEHYIIHFALLKFYLEMGATITKIHRMITFQQSAFFEPYISFK
jgi:hypothetical protein